MAKTNFTKVEEALAAGLRKMSIEELDKLAEISQNIGRPELRNLAEKAIVAAMKKGLEKKAVVYVLRQGAKKYTTNSFYQEFDLTHKQYVELLAEIKSISDENWAKLQLVKMKLTMLREKELKSNPDFQDEKLVEKNRKDQKNARFNVKKTWLPLK